MKRIPINDQKYSNHEWSQQFIHKMSPASAGRNHNKLFENVATEKHNNMIFLNPIDLN